MLTLQYTPVSGVWAVCVPLTDVPGPGHGALDLGPPDEVPDAGHPVSDEGEGGHEQGEHHSAVLGVALQLLKQAQQPEQPHCLQQVHPKVLEDDTNTHTHTDTRDHAHRSRLRSEEHTSELQSR